MDPKEENENFTIDDNFVIKTPDVFGEKRGSLGKEYFHYMKLFGDKRFQQTVATNTSDTYASILSKCIRTALRMRKIDNITSTDIVSFCTYNHQNTCVPYIAATFLGSRIAPLDPNLAQTEAIHILKEVAPAIIFLTPESKDFITKCLDQCNLAKYPKLVIFDHDSKNGDYSGDFGLFSTYLESDEDEADFTPVVTDPDEIAVILHTSGTTGLPKGICHSGYSLCGHLFKVLKVMPPSITLSYSSMYWISWGISLCLNILTGSCAIICKSFDPIQFWNTVQKYKIQFTSIAPIQVTALLNKGPPEVDTSSLMLLITFGGSMSEEKMIKFRDFLPRTIIFHSYGQTEVASGLTNYSFARKKDLRLLRERPTSCGRPLDGIWYRVVDPDTERNLGPNQHGELRVRAQFQFVDIFKSDSADYFDSEGWLRTGDIVYYDEDFCFYVVGRIKEIFKYQTSQIAPAVIENVLLTLAEIKTAVVIGRPHVDDTYHPMAVVILREGCSISEEEIVKFVAERLEDKYRLRGGVKFVQQIPVTSTGKVKRQLLRKIVLEE